MCSLVKALFGQHSSERMVRRVGPARKEDCRFSRLRSKWGGVLHNLAQAWGGLQIRRMEWRSAKSCTHGARTSGSVVRCAVQSGGRLRSMKQTEGSPDYIWTGKGKVAAAHGNNTATCRLARLQLRADRAVLCKVLHSRHWSCGALTPDMCPVHSSEQGMSARSGGSSALHST